MGNALALLNFPKGTLFHRASWSIFKGKNYQSVPEQEIEN
jgi:hypothetical protein